MLTIHVGNQMPCGETISLIDLCTKAEHKPLSFFLQYQDGEFYLDRMHDYYYQVQGQLYITARPWCEFVFWMPNNNFSGVHMV